MRRGAFALVIVCGVATRVVADDEPPPQIAACGDSIHDPIVTPVRERLIDAQRGACFRDELSAALRPHILIDTPGFRGMLGTDLVVGGRMVIAKAHDVSVQLTLVDFSFVQNAVNKVTDTAIGPLVIGGAAGKPLGRHGQASAIARIEIPLTHSEFATTHLSGQLGGVFTGAFTPRLFAHARLLAIGRLTDSLGGATQRLAFIAGADLAWHARRRVSLQLGTDVMAGWDRSLDHVLARAGMHWRVRGGAWRLRLGAGVPLAGAERTTAIVDIAVLVDR